MLKRLLVLCFLIVLTFSVFANGQGEGDKAVPTLRFAHTYGGNDVKSDVFQKLLTEYSDSVNSEVKIESEYTSGLDHKQKIQVEIAGNSAPDVFFYWSYETNLGVLARNDIILDVNEYLELSKNVQREDFSEGAWSSTEIDGKIFGIPIETFKGFMAVNKDIFAKYGLEYPKTWEDMQAVSEVLVPEDIVPLAMGSLRGDPGHLFFSHLTYQAENGFEDTVAMSETGKFDYPGTRIAAKAVQELREMKAIPQDTIAISGWDAPLAMYNDGQAAMIYTFPWMLGAFTEESVARTELIAVPLIPDGAKDPSSLTVGGISMSLVINKKSFEDPAKQAHIVDLVDFLVSDKMFIELTKTGGLLPAKAVSLDSAEYPSELFGMLNDFTATQNVYGLHEFYFEDTETFDGYKSACDELFAGVITPEQFVKQVQNKM